MKEMKSTKTINRFPQPDLNQECPDWKAGILTTTLTALAGRDNYNIHIDKRSIFTVVTEYCVCHITDFKQKVLINITSSLFVYDIRINCFDT